MIDKPEAISIAQHELQRRRRAGQVDLVLLEEETIDKPFGWVFFYDSKDFIRTGDLRLSLIGSSPFIVDRKDGSVHFTGTAHPIEYYVEAYGRIGTIPRPTHWTFLGDITPPESLLQRLPRIGQELAMTNFEMKHCDTCRSPLRGGARFCSVCGAKVSSSGASEGNASLGR
jgi:hypothetical protein